MALSTFTAGRVSCVYAYLSTSTLWRHQSGAIEPFGESYACYPGGTPDIPHLLRKRQNMTTRSAPRGALLAKQTVKKQIRTNFDLRNSSDLFRLVTPAGIEPTPSP